MWLPPADGDNRIVSNKSNICGLISMWRSSKAPMTLGKNFPGLSNSFACNANSPSSSAGINSRHNTLFLPQWNMVCLDEKYVVVWLDVIKS